MEPQSTGCIALFRLEVLVWHGGQAQYVRKRETLYGGRAKVVLNKVFKLFEASKARQVFLVAGGLYLVTFKILGIPIDFLTIRGFPNSFLQILGFPTFFFEIRGFPNFSFKISGFQAFPQT